jgi:ribokinase
MLGRIGRDPLGDGLLAALASEGVDAGDVLRTDGTSGMASVSLTPDGENAIIVAQAANARLTPDDVAAVLEERYESRVLLVQLEIPPETVAAALRRGKALGATTILNPAPAPKGGLPAEILRAADWIVPNEMEAAGLAGGGTPEESAKALLAMGPRAVIITLGAKGALVATRDEMRRIAAPHVQPIDTTGAGDTFLGALGFFVSRYGEDPFGAAALAVRAGALSTTRRGAQAGMPTEEQLRTAGATL